MCDGVGRTESGWMFDCLIHYIYEYTSVHIFLYFMLYCDILCRYGMFMCDRLRISENNERLMYSIYRMNICILFVHLCYELCCIYIIHIQRIVCMHTPVFIYVP